MIRLRHKVSTALAARGHRHYDGRASCASQSRAAYRRGAILLEYCQATLKDAQQQVEVLERGVLKGFVPTADANGSGDDES
jgi:hypothetical protein